MEILKLFSRVEIIKLALEINPIRMKEFIAHYPLTEEEIEMIKTHYKYDTSYLKFKIKTKSFN